GRGAGLGRARLEGVGRAIGAEAGAGLGQVAGAHRSAALGRARLEEIDRAVVGDPVTALGDVTVSGGGPADGRALRVGGAGGAAPRAELGHVADTGRGAALGCTRLEGVGRAVDRVAVASTARSAALGRARLEGVGRAVVRGAVAALGNVTVPRGRAADRRALRIRGATGAAPRAELGHIADTGPSAALGRTRLEGVG